jgi:pimeloyl-ACP methyl ester carboxylesterase
MSNAQQSTQQAAAPAFKLVHSKTLEIAYEDSGPDAGTPVVLAHGFPYDPARLRRGRASPRRGGLPDHRSLSAWIWTDAIPVGGYTAIRPAGRDGPRSH